MLTDKAFGKWCYLSENSFIISSPSKITPSALFKNLFGIHGLLYISIKGEALKKLTFHFCSIITLIVPFLSVDSEHTVVFAKQRLGVRFNQNTWNVWRKIRWNKWKNELSNERGYVRPMCIYCIIHIILFVLFPPSLEAEERYLPESDRQGFRSPPISSANSSSSSSKHLHFSTIFKISQNAWQA